MNVINQSNETEIILALDKRSKKYPTQKYNVATLMKVNVSSYGYAYLIYLILVLYLQVLNIQPDSFGQPSSPSFDNNNNQVLSS